jgi:hypothetical protein
VYKLIQPQDSKYATIFLLIMIPMNMLAMLNFMSWLEELIRRRELQRYK